MTPRMENQVDKAMKRQLLDVYLSETVRGPQTGTQLRGWATERRHVLLSVSPTESM